MMKLDNLITAPTPKRGSIRSYRRLHELDAKRSACLSEEERAEHDALLCEIDGSSRVRILRLSGELTAAHDLEAACFLVRPLRFEDDPPLPSLPMVERRFGVVWPNDFTSVAVLHNEVEGDLVIDAFSGAVSGMPADMRERYIPIKVPHEHRFDARAIAALVGLRLEGDSNGYPIIVGRGFLSEFHRNVLYRMEATEEHLQIDRLFDDPDAPPRDVSANEPLSLLQATLRELATEQVARAGGQRKHLVDFWAGKIPAKTRTIPASEARAARDKANGTEPGQLLAALQNPSGEPMLVRELRSELRELRALIAQRGIEVPSGTAKEGT